MRRTFKYRLYPTVRQVESLEEQLSFACQLYNATLERKRDAWKYRRLTITHNQLSKELTELRMEKDLLPVGMSRSTMQKTLERVDHAFEAFFRRVKAGETPGYPRFRSWRRFDSL